MKNNITLYLTKFCFFAMLLYSVFVLAILRVQIANMTMILGIITVIFMVIDMALINFDLRKLFVSEIAVLVVFFLYSLVIAFLFANNKSSSLVGLYQLLQNLILLVVTIYIVVRDKNIKFVSATFIIVMLIMATYSLINMDGLDSRLTLTEGTNANVLGHNALCGLILLPLFMRTKKTLVNVALIICATLFAVTIVLSSSRMSFVCLLVFALIFFVRIYPISLNNNLKNSSREIKVAIGIIALISILYITIPLLKETLMYERFEGLFSVIDTGEGDGEGRLHLYKRAWDLFKLNPLFGIGYANFAPMNYGIYSHSTYAELLACSGILGLIIYLFFYWKLYKSIKPTKSSKTNTQTEIIRLTMINALIVILILGIGEIVFYKINYYIIFGLIIGYGIISKEGRKSGKESTSFKNSL